MRQFSFAAGLLHVRTKVSNCETNSCVLFRSNSNRSQKWWTRFRFLCSPRFLPRPSFFIGIYKVFSLLSNLKNDQKSNFLRPPLTLLKLNDFDDFFDGLQGAKSALACTPRMSTSKTGVSSRREASSRPGCFQGSPLESSWRPALGVASIFFIVLNTLRWQASRLHESTIFGPWTFPRPSRSVWRYSAWAIWCGICSVFERYAKDVISIDLSGSRQDFH